MKIINRNNQKYIKKIKRKNNHELFKYLSNKSFFNFIEPEEETTSYVLYRYVDDNLPIEDKALNLIYISSLLHTKTTIYEEVNLEKIKIIYEETKQKILKLQDYYYAIQDHIESKIYFSPAEYLLIRNISNIHKLLIIANNLLDEWYNHQKEEKKIRVCTLNQNLKLSNIKQEGNNYYLIDWDNSKKDLVIYDFLNFYQNEYKYLEMTSLYELYISKYQLLKEEQLFLFANISIPSKVELNKSNYENTLNVKYLTIYVEKTIDFISKYNKKD